MKTHKELLDTYGEGELAYVSALFWNKQRSSIELLPKNISAHPEHPVWVELLTFQNGWFSCKEIYKIRD